jgi:beta-glucosidase
MNRSRRSLARWIFLFLPIFLAFPLLPQSVRQDLADPKNDARAEALLKRMTLDEKIGQLVQYSFGTPTGPGTTRDDYPQLLVQGRVGSFFNLTDAQDVNATQRIAVEKSRLHIPLIFGRDVIHGYHTVFPIPLGMSATWNPELVEQAARAAAVEATSAGISWTFSPMVDIARDARWGRIAEGAGEDPYLGMAMARAYVRGYQGPSLSDPTSMLACAKHFVGYGAGEGGREYNTADISDRMLRQIYLPPFQAAVEAGAATVMSAFNSLQEVPSTVNPFTLSQILKGEWGFRGFVVSDWTSISELVNHGIALDDAMAARKALTAGVDMDMQGNLYATVLADQVRSGKIPESVVDDAARRVLRVKFAMGLFEHPYVDESKSPMKNLDPEHVDLARRVAEESFVLLKNYPPPLNPPPCPTCAVNYISAPLLPLNSTPRKVALVGPLADSAENMLGSWALDGRPEDVVTLRAALAERLNANQGKLLYAKGTEINTDSENGFAEAISDAGQADVVVAALGEDAKWMTGEAGSRAHLGLPGNQEKLLEALVATGKPVVLIVFSGRPLVLNWAAEHVPAILEAWFPGVQAGPALVRMLFGDVNPSGRLTTSFPRAVGQEPLYYDALNTGRPAEGGVWEKKTDLSRPPQTTDEKYVSRYVDVPNSALYPFGYGLSYTRFDYSPVTLSVSTFNADTLKKASEGDATFGVSAEIPLSATSLSADALNQGSVGIGVTAEVKNAGGRAGSEVVQLYIRQQGTSVARPVRELEGFRKITLAPGESKQVEFWLGREQLAFWNIDMKDVVEPANVTVWVGGSSVEGSEAGFTIH